MKPSVGKVQGKHAWQRWIVVMAGKVPVYFEHWYAAVAHAIYVARNPCAMEDAA